MKKIILLISAAVLLVCWAARAQFIAGPSAFNAVTNAVWTNAFTVAASATTNLGASARVINVGVNGFGVHVYAAAASTSLATNTLAFEYSGDGSNWVLQPLLQVFVTNGTATGTTLYTNFPPTLANIGNLKAIRLKHITNSSAAVTFWTNIIINTR